MLCINDAEYESVPKDREQCHCYRHNKSCSVFEFRFEKDNYNCIEIAGLDCVLKDDTKSQI